jgi:hypothetical protein
MKHYEIEISDLLNGELDNSIHDELFEHLNQCNDCRNCLIQFMSIQQKSATIISKDVNAYLKNYDHSLNTILGSFKIQRGIKNGYYKAAFYISAAASVILFLLMINKKPEISYLTREINRVDTVYIPSSRTAYKSEQSIKKSNQSNPEINQRNYLKIISKIPSRQIVLASYPLPEGE